MQSADKTGGQSKSGDSQENQGEGSEASSLRMSKPLSLFRSIFSIRSYRQNKNPSRVVHYAFGTPVGAGYGLLAANWADCKIGGGLVPGSLLWLVSRGVAVPIAGFPKPPQDYPLGTHASALAPHYI